jgi:hypothetical protein
MQRHIWGNLWTETKGDVLDIHCGSKTHRLTSAATIWWPRVKLKISQAELSKLHGMTCMGITEAMRTAAMEALLGIPPLHSQVEMEAKVGSYRL